MVRFDDYTAKTQAANPYQLAELFGPGLEVAQGRGFHQFGHRLAFKDGTGVEVGAVLWGGAHGDRSMIEVKGERTPEVVERLRSRFPHRVTRGDACADFDAPGAWRRLLRPVLATKRKFRLYGERRGDWSQPEKGRTQYLGSDQSVTRLRLYEKGKQPEYAHLGRTDWVRAEIQVRPAAPAAKEQFAQLAPLEFWGASPWSRDLAGAILTEHVDPHPAGTVYRQSDEARKLHWLCKQYGPLLLSMLEDCGDWANVGRTIGSAMEQLSLEKDRGLQ